MMVFAFYLYAVVAVIAAFMVVMSRNPVHSVLWLILTVLSASGLFVLIGAEFVAMLLIIVYVGAVAVLFLFVVMMLDIRIDRISEGFWKHFPVAAAIGALIALEMAVVLMGGFGTLDEAKPVAELLDAQGQVLPYSNTQALGRLMYTEYLFPIEVAAAILLVAMIAAIALTLRKRKDAKTPNITGQINARAQDRLTLVSMPATQAAATAKTQGEETK